MKKPAPVPSAWAVLPPKPVPHELRQIQAPLLSE